MHIHQQSVFCIHCSVAWRTNGTCRMQGAASITKVLFCILKISSVAWQSALSYTYVVILQKIIIKMQTKLNEILLLFDKPIQDGHIIIKALLCFSFTLPLIRKLAEGPFNKLQSKWTNDSVRTESLQCETDKA